LGKHLQQVFANLLAGKKVGVFASTNAAVNNIAVRNLDAIDTQGIIDLEEKLIVRLCRDQIELKIL